MPAQRAHDRVHLTLDDVERGAHRHGVPVEDALLIAINLYGVSSDQNRHRARVTVRLTVAPAVSWMVIVPLNAHQSPFTLSGEDLYLGEHLIASVSRIDADEAVGGYFRNGGLAATLNPNARSRCVGCAFCPNTLEAAADPRLAEDRELRGLFSAMVEQHPRRDLTELEEVTISTGCFGQEEAAVAHVLGIRRALDEQGISARIGFLTSVIHSDDAFASLADAAAPFVLRLTVECITRRDLLLKESKAQLKVGDMARLLHRARSAGLETSFTFVVGLDSLEEMLPSVTALAEHVTEFPNFQVYQAHNSIMAGLRTRDAGRLDFYLEARTAIEQIHGLKDLRPMAWECYRPLWYFAFAGESLLRNQ